MDRYGLNGLRRSYLKFFKGKGHLVLPSFSLVPQNDPSLLLINAGMAPFKPYFTGVEEPPCDRVATCQKCIRTSDIENVGKTSRYGTFFEMLGNFSFGDYFKKEAITWAWEYFTEILKLNEDLLYVSVFEEDDEAYNIWKDVVGINEEKIFRLGEKDNFWELGTGVCGPCSEIYFDRGEKYGCDDSNCVPGCDCDRFIEVWNLVFTQFDKYESGEYHLLPKPNIDTGMGLERLGLVCQGAENLFEVDAIKGILDHVSELTSKKYGENEKDDISIRIITDHIRGTTHMISDGIMPSNEGRGYVLRRLLRGAARHGRLLGSKQIFLHDLSLKVIELSKEAYPELLEKQEHIYNVIKNESEKFNQTLDMGMEVLRKLLQNTKNDTLDGENAFKLHDTFGFPIDLTKEIAMEHGKKIDEDGFLELMRKQREKARGAFKSKNVGWTKEDEVTGIISKLENEFIGYMNTEGRSKLTALFSDKEEKKEANAGETINAVFKETPFYAESGGQVGDVGMITSDDLKAVVVDVIKINGIHIHLLEIEEGSINVGEEYDLKADKRSREAVMRNHTATHILHKALYDEVGSHVEQKGSYVDDNRLRFDFSQYEAIDRKVLEKIENKVNEIVFSTIPVNIEEMTFDEAKCKGAKAFFNEKYSEMVRVVSVGDYSIELCGGTHVSNSGQIGPFKILSESSIASGIRRIEAITGFNVLDYYGSKEKQIDGIARVLKIQKDDIRSKIESLIESNKNLIKELVDIKQKITTAEMTSDSNKPEIVKGIAIFSKLFSDVDVKTLRDTVDTLKDKNPGSVIIMGSVSNNKVNFIVSATDTAVSKGLHAGNIVKEIAATAGGGGGGKATFAQAGGKNPEMAQKALDKGIELVKQVLGD